MNISSVSVDLVRELPDKRAALRACVLYSGKALKEVAFEIGVNDPGHLSKMLNVQTDPRHFPPEKENILMDVCGNEIPLLWSLITRGYQPPAEVAGLQLENAQLREQINQLRADLDRCRQESRQTFNIFKNVELR